MPIKKSTGLLRPSTKGSKGLLLGIVVLLIAAGVYIFLQAHASGPISSLSWFNHYGCDKSKVGDWQVCDPAGQVTSVKDLGYNAWVLEMQVPGSVAAGSAASTAKQTISVSAGCYNLSAVVRHVAGNSSVRTSIRVNWTGDGGSYMVPAYTDTNWHAGNLINFKIPSGVSQATVATYTTKPTSSSITGVWQWDTIAVNPVVCPAQ